MDYSIITTSDPRPAVMARFWQHWREVTESPLPTEIVVVDDRQLWCDTRDEELRAQVPRLTVRVVRPERPVGQAAAMRLGAEAAGSELMLFMDPDMVEALADTAALLAPFAQGAMAVHGVRCSGASRHWVRRLGSALSNLTVRWIAGIRVPDINSPVFVHRRASLALLASTSTPISNPQLTLYALLGEHVIPVPVSSEYAAARPSSYSPASLVALFVRQVTDAWRVRQLRRTEGPLRQ